MPHESICMVAHRCQSKKIKIKIKKKLKNRNKKNEKIKKFHKINMVHECQI